METPPRPSSGPAPEYPLRRVRYAPAFESPGEFDGGRFNKRLVLEDIVVSPGKVWVQTKAQARTRRRLFG